MLDLSVPSLLIGARARAAVSLLSAWSFQKFRMRSLVGLVPLFTVR